MKASIAALATSRETRGKIAALMIGLVLPLALGIPATYALDLRTESPESTARKHVTENLEGIHSLVQQAREDDMPLGLEANPRTTVDCWEENDPALQPTRDHDVQRCRIRFGHRIGSVSADYLVVTRPIRREWPGQTLLGPNHEVADAYLDPATVQRDSHREEIRPEAQRE